MSFTNSQTTYQKLPRQIAQNDSSDHRRHRENNEWLAALSGEMGTTVQQQKHEALSTYLWVVVQGFILRRQPDFRWLATLASAEIAMLTQDIVQICLEKLCRDEYRLLNQFSGKGSFKGWVSQIALNAARSELRKVRWDRQEPLDKLAYYAASDTPSPEQTLQQQYLNSILYRCLDQLPSHYQTVLIRCVINGEPTKDVAQDLLKSNQAIYNLVNRAKARLGELLVQENVCLDDLAVFGR